MLRVFVFQLDPLVVRVDNTKPLMLCFAFFFGRKVILYFHFVNIHMTINANMIPIMLPITQR